MPFVSRISEKMFTRVAEQALHSLYERFPEPLSTAALAREIARDNEFCLRVLGFLEKKGMAKRVGNLPQKKLWTITPAARKKYDSALQQRG